MRSFLVIAILLGIVGCSSSAKRPEHYREDKEFHPKVAKAAYINLHPKVCFDEGHNNLAVEFGFYDSVLELLESDGFEVIRLNKRFTKDVLKGCKIVYSSTVAGHPDNVDDADESAFDVEEIESITKWVREGGNFLMMSDHGSMAKASSKLLKQFNIHGSIESVQHPKGVVAAFADNGIFTLQAKELSETSPIVLGRNFSERLKKIHYFRGQALKGPANSDYFLKVPTDAKVGTRPPGKFRALGIATKQGRGRVVVIGDGSVFAAKIDERNDEKTGLNRADNDNVQMAINVFRWLSGALY